ncbi:hypothetical protein [Geodermatophilus marinus]|uniref:hypothetical protein n=1 Tax=Geodermatophilus sp. LHW52908 TaxID=2303986 RepID=UPI000E3B823A|nr:hypothetical protein [Geodermatophilus sp. LHW52908]RFU19617.1 hypothetical protein D0Z06_20540 [Geodermatophilus sp. LHW52908]
MVTWLLVHPPLLGPAVLRPLADELRARGATVAVPDLRGAVRTAQGWPRRWVDGAARAGPAEVVVGFSGAGITLPAVAAAVRARRVVWLDAVLADGTWPEEVRRLVAPLVRDGRIADWTTWWGPDAMTGLLPDERLRAAVLAEGHELPVDFFDVPVPVPPGRPDAGARYVHLSPAYDGDAAAARGRGWPVAGDGTGEHLDVANHPRRVADLLG